MAAEKKEKEAESGEARPKTTLPGAERADDVAAAEKRAISRAEDRYTMSLPTILGTSAGEDSTASGDISSDVDKEPNKTEEPAEQEVKVVEEKPDDDDRRNEDAASPPWVGCCFAFHRITSLSWFFKLFLRFVGVYNRAHLFTQRT